MFILQFVRPVCLPETPSSDATKYDNDYADVIGWGSSQLIGKPTKHLKRIALKIYSQR